MVITSERAFNKRAKQLIKMLLNGEEISHLSQDDLNILAECINLGYLNSKYLLKTEDGNYHFELYENSVVTAKGIQFTVPKHDWKFIVPTLIAILELIVIIIQTTQSA